MSDRLPINTRVRIDPASEHYPGQLVYIVEHDDDPEYSYCVSPIRGHSSPERSFWVRSEHVRAITRPKKRIRRPTGSTPAQSPKPPSRPPAGPSEALEPGDLVMVDSLVPLGTRLGYVIGLEPGPHGRVTVCSSPHPQPESILLWVKRDLVTKLEVSA